MPKTIAVIGASSDRRKFGNRALRAFLEEGHRVIPINPHERTVELPWRATLSAPSSYFEPTGTDVR